MSEENTTDVEPDEGPQSLTEVLDDIYRELRSLREDLNKSRSAHRRGSRS